LSTLHLQNLLTRLLTYSAAVYYFSFLTADPDLWGHIQFGKDLFCSAHFIWEDPYSFTANGHQWINHEWLSELIFYVTYRYFGDAGMLLGKLGIGICIAAILTRLCRYRKQTPIIYTIIMILCISVISPGFMIRPQLFSFLLFTVFFFLFYLYLEQGKNYLFLLPLLMMLWVNLHGGFLMGWIFMVVIVFCQTLARFFGSENGDEIRTLWLWLMVSSLAILANPYGPKLLHFLYHSLSIGRQISEWSPLPFWDRSMLGFKIMAVLFFCCLLRYYKKNKGWEITSILLLLLASLRHQRHMPFFGIMAAPYVIFGLSTLVFDFQNRFSKLILTDISRCILAVFFCLQAVYLLYQTAGRYVDTGFRIIVDPETYPVQAVQFMKKNGLKGNLFVPFEWGEYGIWKLYPECRVSIDGRFRTVYPETVIRDHFIGIHDRSGWENLIRKYPSDILLVRQIPFFQDLIRNQTEWTYVYSDSIGIVFIRNSTKNRDMLERFRSGGFAYPASAPSIYFP
jgi:hypothetical protein